MTGESNQASQRRKGSSNTLSKKNEQYILRIFAGHKIEIKNIFVSKKPEINFFIKFHLTKPTHCLANNNVLNKILHVVFMYSVLKF